MLPFQSKPESRVTFEDVFFEHYSRLFEWALQLTNRDRFEAEDLIQELYIRFARVGTVGDHIENAKEYIFSVLRNLHYARIRREKNSALDELSVVDYESAEGSLRAIDRGTNLFVQEDLYRLCDYFCERKNRSRSASIFILRYFLGYFPNEVMRVVRCTRVAVDKALQASRREAKLEPVRRGSFRQTSIADTNQRTPNAAGESSDLFSALRARIFCSCSGECWDPQELESKYTLANQNCSTEELAHLVSCSGCLDRVNRFLGIPSLDQRSPDDTIGRDSPGGSEGPSGPTSRLVSRGRKKEDEQQRRNRMKRRAQEAQQHRPQHISIAVDGNIRASQLVTARLSGLRLELSRMEKLESVEVLSERNVCLAFLPVRSLFPEANLQQSQEFELSDGRTLSVTVSFTAEAPTIEVVYQDPLLDAAPEAEQTEGMESASMHAASAPPLANEGNLVRFPARIWHWLKRIHSPRINPFFAGGIAFSLCCATAVLLWMNNAPPISPAALLQHAQQSEAAVTTAPNPEVVYQKVRITGGGHTLERVIHRDPARKHKAKQQKLDLQAQALKESLDLVGVDWDQPLSAGNYGAWRDMQPLKHDVITRAGKHLLTLTTSTGTVGQVIRESLTVRESDFHPVARAIELRGEETIEIAELNYNVVPWGPASQQWFDPLPGEVVSDLPTALPGLGLRHSPSTLELNDAELSVRYVLHRIGADLGDPINVETGKDKHLSVHVSGAVSSRERKQELLAALSGMPHVTLDIQSEDETKQRNLHGPVRSAPPLMVTPQSPIETELRAFLGDSSSAESFSKQAIAISGDLMAHAWALRHLSERYGASAQGEMTLSLSSRELLEAIRQDHYRAISETGSKLSTMLGPLLQKIAADDGVSRTPRVSLFASAQQVQRLTLALLSGTESQDANGIQEPAQAARDLLHALRSLEIALEEIHADRGNHFSFDEMHS